uniref:MARVEL domain-containing protein n=1 Tax=Acrobeloides nanus TaxID=290746 RepID=A0A914E5S9_9BILA
MMEKIICLRYPHLFKPVQSVNAIILLICLGTADSVEGSGVLWFITLLSLFVSAVATVLFLLDKNEPILYTITGGAVSWNVVEFVYSTVLAVLCFLSTWLSFTEPGRVKDGGSYLGYTFAAIFFFLQTIFYTAPALLFFDKMRDAETGRDLSNEIHYVDDAEVPYQGERIA